MHVLALFTDIQNKIILLGLQNGLIQEEGEKGLWFILLPNGCFKLFWNLILVSLLLYTATIMPYRIAFLNDDDPIPAVITFDIIIDLLFAFDLFVNLISAYEDSDG